MDPRCQYHRDGLLFPIPVFTADEAARYRGQCDELERRLGGRPRTVEVRQMHLHFQWAYDLATHRRVLDAVEGLLGPNLLVWSTELFAKHPGDGITIGWHRDEDYTGFDPELSTTAWIALSGSTRENGCLQVVPGSHREESAAPCSSNAAQPPPTADRLVEVLLQPGEMSLHDGRLLHGSSANASAEDRVGFVVRYVAPSARPADGRPPALLARGVDDYGHFQIVPPPVNNDYKMGLEALRASASRHLDAMIANLQHAKTHS